MFTLEELDELLVAVAVRRYKLVEYQSRIQAIGTPPTDVKTTIEACQRVDKVLATVYKKIAGRRAEVS